MPKQAEVGWRFRGVTGMDNSCTLSHLGRNFYLPDETWRQQAKEESGGLED